MKPSTDPSLSTLSDRELIEAFLENIPDFVTFKDRESRIIAVSASKARRHGLTHRQEMIGLTDQAYYEPAQALTNRVDEETVMRTQQSVIARRQKINFTGDKTGWGLVTKTPLEDEAGNIIGTFGITTDITVTVDAEMKLEKTRRELLEFSRQAGRAEVATGVLHNIGNVLNSLNVSATVLATGLRQSKTESMGKIIQLIEEHAADLPAYLTHDPKGRLVPEFIASLARHTLEERDRLIQEVTSLQKNIDHIKEIVSMQQSYATMIGVIEAQPAAQLMEDSLLMNAGALDRHDVNVVRDYQPVPLVMAEKGKVLQILINVIRNGKYACDEGGKPDKTLTLRIQPGPVGFVHLSVQDNGIGISPENFRQLFEHGFTTRSYGHGFGLHSSANAAKEMHGSLSVESKGVGHGATFTLALPIAKPPPA